MSKEICKKQKTELDNIINIIQNYTKYDDIKILLKAYENLQNYIKDKLALELARGMINGKLIHFSLIEDIASGATEYRARCFATPDNQTRLILNTKKR